MSFKLPDIDQILAQWLGEEDSKQAVAISTIVLEAVCEGRLDPMRNWELIKAAAEPQFDGPGGKPVRVLAAIRVAAPMFRAAEAFGGLKDPERLRLRCELQLLLTRTYHLMDDCTRPALENAYANLEFVIDFAGGYEVMIDILRRRAATPLAEQAIGALGIMCAVIRPCTNLDSATRERLIERCRGLLNAYIIDAEGPLVIYPKTDSATAQGFYLFKRLGQPQDSPLIEALYHADVVARPEHARAQRTIPLRDIEYARFRGDCAAAARYRHQARANLDPNVLPRHERAVVARGYLDD